MLSWAPLRAVCLASLLLSWIGCSVVAIPVPIHPINLNAQTGTRFTSNTDGLHAQRVQQHAALPANQQAHPGHVTVHAVPHPNGQAGHGHLMGTVVADPNSQHHMNSRTLAAHVERIDQHLQANGHGPHKIDVHHTDGNSHVMFHATPLHHDATVQPPHGGTRHAVLNPGDSPNNVLVTSNSAHRSTIHHQLSAKTHPQDGSPRDPAYTKHTANGVTTGSIPIAAEQHRHGMTAQDLQAHAHYVHNLVAKNDPNLREKLHVHVTHRPGDGHVNFHVTPGQQSVSRADIQAHLDSHGNTHYQGAPIARDHRTNAANPNVDHKYTFHGTVPSHSTAQLSPAELRVYADHARNQLVAHHGLQGADANNMVVAATHKAGDRNVHFHTQPTHSLVMNRNQGTHPGGAVDPLAARISQHISAANGGEEPWHHAEAGALYDSLRAKGVHNNMATFNQQVAGHSVGVAGAWNQPCDHCKNTLDRLHVNY